MTVTAHPAKTTAAVNAWLAEFGDALAAGDPAAAAALFAPDCYWRDLVAFTWNIKTMEGRDAIAEMLAAVLPGVTPGGWRITPGEEPAEAGGVTEAWSTSRRPPAGATATCGWRAGGAGRCSPPCPSSPGTRSPAG